jgi:hypothetical protein
MVCYGFNVTTRYTKWENFSKAIDRAMLSCDTAGFDIKYHFPILGKLVEMPSKPRKNGTNLGFPNARKTKEILEEGAIEIEEEIGIESDMILKDMEDTRGIGNKRVKK